MQRPHHDDDLRDQSNYLKNGDRKVFKAPNGYLNGQNRAN